MVTFADAYEIKERLARFILNDPKIQGIGVGYRDPRRPRRGAAVIIYTNTVSASSLGIPSSFSTNRKRTNVMVPVRFVKTKEFLSHVNYRSRIRPLLAGYSIGTTRGSGTAGLIVTAFPLGNNKRFILSNNHVLTNPTNSRNRAVTLQPGGADNGRRNRNRIGHLERLAKLQRNRVNYMDAAVAVPVRTRAVNPRYAAVGVVPGHVTSFRVGDRFKKVGRTTGFTYGVVDSVNTDVSVGYARLGSFRFKNQTVIAGAKPVSLPGDSGSVWLRRSDNFAAAVNFAGSDDGKMSIAFPIHWFMVRFGARVARPKGVGLVRSVKSKDGNPAYTRQLSRRELSSIKVVYAR